jgi:aromatic-L-amino-acid/L-tryptophan decarboxylase
LILPGVTHWQSPNFFAYFPCNASGPGILGDLLSSGLGVQGMLWSTSPACTELETHVMDWLVGMLGLPEKFLSSSTGGGVIQDTASSAALCALLAARERATGYVSNKKGCNGKLVAYASTQTHSSLEKAAMIAGMGVESLRLIEVDENFAMRPEALARQIEADRRAGLTPCFVCATVGTTSSNAMDPIAAISEICKKENLWLHVDAAMSGTAMLCPEFRHLQSGVELADSYNFNPHKWMFTSFDCNCFWVADRKALDSDAEHPPGVSTKPGHRIGRGDRLPRLAYPAWTPLPITETVVCDPALWRGRFAASHPRACTSGAAIRGLDSERRPL